MPTRKLLIKRGHVWEPKTEIIGPGYRAAYGLVALVHHQIEGVNERGELQLMDHRIRTHGTAAYLSVKRGESNGCHRLHEVQKPQSRRKCNCRSETCLATRRRISATLGAVSFKKDRTRCAVLVPAGSGSHPSVLSAQGTF